MIPEAPSGSPEALGDRNSLCDTSQSAQRPEITHTNVRKPSHIDWSPKTYINSISRLSSTRLLRVARSAKIRPGKSLRADSDCRLAGSRASAKIDRVASWGSKAKFGIGHCTAQRVWRAHRPQTCCARWICPAKLSQKTCHKQPSRRTRNVVTSEV